MCLGSGFDFNNKNVVNFEELKVLRLSYFTRNARAKQTYCYLARHSNKLPYMVICVLHSDLSDRPQS